MNLRGQQRREFPQTVRKLAFKRCCKNGIPYCETCELQIRGTPIFEHVIPAGLGGEPILENCKVHCKTCATEKTVKEDNPRMAKADAVLKHNFGLEPAKKPIRSQGFRPSAPQRTASRPVRKWSVIGDQR